MLFYWGTLFLFLEGEDTMNNENNTQPTNKMFCSNCGNEVERGYRFCAICGTENQQHEKHSEVQSSNNVRCLNCGHEFDRKYEFCENCGVRNQQPHTYPVTPITSNQTIPANNYSFENNSGLPKKRKSSKMVISIIIMSFIAVLSIVLLILINTHVICISHEWKAATCTEPKICIYCGETKGSTLDHSRGSWTIVKSATLVEGGVEEQHCTECKKTLNSRTTSCKEAKVVGKSFNFKDAEFIAWFNQKSSARIGYDDLELSGLSENNTSYQVTLTDGTIGVVILNHDDKGYIQAIMICFEDWAEASAMAIWVGEKIDSRFSSDTAISRIARKSSYSAGNMTIKRYNLDYDFEVTVLATSSFFN